MDSHGDRENQRDGLFSLVPTLCIITLKFVGWVEERNPTFNPIHTLKITNLSNAEHGNTD